MSPLISASAFDIKRSSCYDADFTVWVQVVVVIWSTWRLGIERPQMGHDDEGGSVGRQYGIITL